MTHWVFLAPSTVLLKFLLEHVRKTRLSWNVPLPISIQEKWYKVLSQINSFNSMFIPQVINLNIFKTELHVFCYSSTQVYFAAVYLKSIDNTTIKKSLAIAKTRIGLARKCTLSRLELGLALLLSELIKAI